MDELLAGAVLPGMFIAAAVIAAVHVSVDRGGRQGRVAGLA